VGLCCGGVRCVDADWSALVLNSGTHLTGIYSIPTVKLIEALLSIDIDIILHRQGMVLIFDPKNANAVHWLKYLQPALDLRWSDTALYLLTKWYVGSFKN